jgi:hypothetical protein
MAKEVFDDCVVQTVAPPRHALSNPIGPKNGCIVSGCILASLVGMQNDLVRLEFGHGLGNSVYNKLKAWMPAYVISSNFVVQQV